MGYDACMPTILFESADLLALNKPAGLITHRDGRTLEPSVAEWIAEHYPDMTSIGAPWMSPQGEAISISGLVHRLDRPTSGVLLAARTPEMFEYLKAEFKARRVTKMYRALVRGHVVGDAGRIVAAIERTSTVPKRWYAVPREESHVRAAITDFTVLSRGTTPTGESYTYLEIYPKTGRTHQIRVHMASIGHPLVGDHQYDASALQIFGFTYPALHALGIECMMPQGDRMTFEAPLPSTWAPVL